MKFREIFRYEFNYQLRSPRTWLIFIALTAFAFLFVRVNFIAEALYADHFVNAPFLIAGATVFGGLIWLGVAAFIAGEAASRDMETRMYPLVYTAPIGKAAYLGGRFLASLAINALLLLGVQAGILLAYYLPGTDTGQLSPFRPAAYLTAYAIISLPNALVATAIQYLLVLRSGRAMAGYLGSFLLVFMGFFVASALLYHYGLGGLLDPIGIRFVVEDLAHLWTTIEQNTRLIGLEGKILTNRLLWVGVALASLIVAYLSFNFSQRAEQSPLRPLYFILRKVRSGRRQDHAQVHKQQSVQQNLPVLVPRFQKSSGFKTTFSQVFAIATDSFQYLASSWAGLALLLFVPLMTVPVVIDQLGSVLSPVLPTTLRVLGELTAPLSAELSRWVIIPLIIVFFAGELVWRERDYRLGDLTDALPLSEWVPLLGKFLGLSIILTLFLFLQMMAGILAQTMLGYQKFEIGLYLKILFGFQLTDYLLFALLALVVHVVVHQKYVGHLVAVVAFVFIAMAPMFGIEHNLLIYGASPGWTYTEIRGFGPSLVPWLWFKAYWAAWALLLAVAARLLWARGREEGLRARLRGVRNRLTRTTLGMATVAAGLVLSLGGSIFYNTNVINEYLTSSDTNARKAEYERRYSQYASIPQPRLTSTKIHVEIYPRQRVADIRGTYLLVNKSTVAIDSIHLDTGLGAKTEDIDFGQLATLTHSDEALHHRIYTLKKPLHPGDSLRLSFRVRYAPRGFREDGVDDAITAHGTSISSSWLPTIGYDKSRELLTPSDRREFGLTPRPLIASLYDVSARKTRGSGVAFEAVVGTDANQVPVAPGALRRSWTDSTTSTGKRRYFHYATSAPIGSEWAIYSAR
ncbi:MAG: hypothetical protein KKG00_09655, partial [Bacteroidetes bacterium]|nr:hypothetical protein [Bacteroidota bacterium]